MGFTLIELLVSIGIIGLLTALLLPAVQAAREAASNVRCRNNLRQIGIAMHRFHNDKQHFPSGYRFVPGSYSLGVGTANVAMLPYFDQNVLHDKIDLSVPWFLMDPEIAKAVVPEFICPSDPGDEVEQYHFLTPLSLEVGDRFARSSYLLSVGTRDSLCFGSGLKAPSIANGAGVFAFHSETTMAMIKDGLSNTFAIGEGASGDQLCNGIGCTTPLPKHSSKHGWLVGGASLESLYVKGARYSGGWGSTTELLNKSPVTDSFYKTSDNAYLDCRSSSDGGPHWVSNFRSFHPGGANFLFCDGSVHWLSEGISRDVFRALSTVADGEIHSIP